MSRSTYTYRKHLVFERYYYSTDKRPEGVTSDHYNRAFPVETEDERVAFTDLMIEHPEEFKEFFACNIRMDMNVYRPNGDVKLLWFFNNFMDEEGEVPRHVEYNGDGEVCEYSVNVLFPVTTREEKLKVAEWFIDQKGSDLLRHNSARMETAVLVQKTSAGQANDRKKPLREMSDLLDEYKDQLPGGGHLKMSNALKRAFDQM